MSKCIISNNFEDGKFHKGILSANYVKDVLLKKYSGSKILIPKHISVIEDDVFNGVSSVYEICI